MSWVGGKLITGSSGTLPTHAAGDLIVIMAVKWASGSPTPTVPSGWMSSSSATNVYRRAIGWRVAAASGTASGTWSNAEALYVSIWRNAQIGATASTASSSKAGGVPALTLTQPGTSRVGLMGSGDEVTPTLPAGMVQRLRASGTGVNDLYADTDGPVSSWPAQSGNYEAVAALELIPTIVSVTKTWSTTREISQFVTKTWSTTREIAQLSVTKTWSTTREISQFVTKTWSTTREINAIGNWRNALVKPGYRAALLGSTRTVSARAELIGWDGSSATWLDRDGNPLTLALASATVNFSGEMAEQWALTATVADPGWVPRSPTHPLDPRSAFAIRLWWRLWVDGDWVDIPVGTFNPTEPKVTDDGIVTVDFVGRDMLAVAKGSGYGGQVLDLGGMTVDAALARLFRVLVPAVQFRADPTTVTLPDTYEVGISDSPADDWAAIAEVAGWVVRTDREGIITAGPPPTPALAARSLQEGPDCAIVDISREISNVVYNRVVVVSTNADIDPPVWGVAQDDDESSPTWVGLGVIRQLRIESDVPTTVKACQNMAAMHLGRYLRPTESVTIRIPADPTLNYRDIISLGRPQAGVVGDYRVSKWTMNLPVPGETPGLMSVTMMRRSVP